MAAVGYGMEVDDEYGGYSTGVRDALQSNREVGVVIWGEYLGGDGVHT